MSTIVIYRSKYGSTKKYAEWISEELCCEMLEFKNEKIDELSLPHKAALKALKVIMQGKENPTEMEKLLIDLCDASGDFTEKSAIKELIEYVKA